MPLDISIVGCGAVAQRLYSDALRRLERQGLLRVTALVDPVESHAQAMRQNFRHAQVIHSLTEALDTVPSQLALILSPAHLHTEHVLLAIAKGRHVLCEKPLAMSSAECQAMIEAAIQARRTLAVGMIRRFFPAYAQLRAIVASGCLGDLVSIDYSEGRKFDWDVTTAAAFRPRQQGGTGVLFDIGPHALDCLHWIFGPANVRMYADDNLGGVESNLSLDLEFNGLPCRIRLSWDSPLRNELRVRGSRSEAVLRLDRFDKLALRDRADFVAVPITQSFAADLRLTPREKLSPASYPQAMYCQLIQTLRAIHFGEPPAADGLAGLQCVSILESAVNRSRPLPMPWLDPLHQRRFAELHGVLQR